MAKAKTIAIDGPVASGKSVVGERVAHELGYLYFDTGAMYRAITFLALQHKLDLSSSDEVGRLAEECVIEFEAPTPATDDGRQYTVRVGEQDITWQLREPSVERHVSQVAAYPRVRTSLKQQQRRIGQRGKVVMVGRDIGTVVMPDAPLKIYLDASVEVRARRRYEQKRQQGKDTNFERILADLRQRDHRDSTRAIDPLRPAEDAQHIYTDGLSIDEVVAEILRLASQHGV